MTFESRNPRADALRALVVEAAEAAGDERVLVLVRDTASAKALQAWIAIDAHPSAAWLDRLDVLGYPDYWAIARRRYHSVIVSGVVPRRYRWAMGAALGADVVLLSYPHECTIVERQLAAPYEPAGAELRTKARARGVRGLFPDAGRRDGRTGGEVRVPEFYLKRPAERPVAPSADDGVPTETETVTVRSLQELAATFRRQQADEHARREARRLDEEERRRQEEERRRRAADLWPDDAGDDEAPIDDLATGDAVRDPFGLQSLRVDVESRTRGRGVIWFGVDQVVESVRAGGGEVRHAQAAQLRPGDVILLTDEGGRASLFERIVDLVEGQPHLQYLAAHRRIWRHALQTMASKYTRYGQVRYDEILADLQRAGATVETDLSVRWWINDQVIGPASRKSIEAVGKVSGVDIIHQQPATFDRVFREIRGIHTGVGLRLSAAIRRTFHRMADAPNVSQAAQIDDRIGLPLDELLETIEFAEVLEVGKQEEQVSPHWVGRFVKVTA